MTLFRIIVPDRLQMFRFQRQLLSGPDGGFSRNLAEATRISLGLKVNRSGQNLPVAAHLHFAKCEGMLLSSTDF
ncbi:hypothetical protein [Labrenzia sp. DG1229]|uniref:hypothetical protein n=1 Tax=Labrenzia sp. DG1229 TaxID=681847 RepID=UPI0012EC83F1|nr:hypothetical protein [Labrenzia sp. DG1229]